MHIVDFRNPATPTTREASIEHIRVFNTQVILYCSTDREPVCNIVLTHNEVKHVLIAYLEGLQQVEEK